MPISSIATVRRFMDIVNRCVAEGRPITRADVEDHFTDDAVMVANNRIKCSGIDGHMKHFDEISIKMKQLHIKDFEIVADTPDVAAAYYRIDFVDREGVAGTVYDAAFWAMRDGKIARMTEVVHFEGASVSLDDH